MPIAHSVPCERGNAMIEVQPATVGAVVSAMGTAGFADAVGALISEQIPIDALHLDRWRPCAGSAAGYAVEWFGSWGPQYADVSNLMAVYYQHYWRDDPLNQQARARKGTLLLQRHVDGIAEGELRRRFFDEPRIAQECMLVHGDAKCQYALSLTRSRGRAAFGLDELFHVRRLADMLFPMFESHVRTYGERRHATAAMPTAPDEGFDAHLLRANIRLSERERELCKLLLSRWSVPQVANHLDIKLSTAKTYVERAFAKLGVRNRSELFAWAANAD